MPKVVLDTNIFVSGIFFRPSNPGRIVDAWWEHKINLVISPPLFKEILKILVQTNKRLGSKLSLIEKFKENVKEFAFWIKVEPEAKICRDSKDNMILDTAFQGGADFVVTEDKDLLVLKKYKAVAIVTPARFIKELRL
jgi:putative PIN family toxin of toxin-antitoxin system